MNTTTYEDNRRKQETESALVLYAGIASDWNGAKEKAKSCEEMGIEFVNLLYSCGIKLQDVSHHNILSFEFYERQMRAGNLPKDMTWLGCKRCLSLARGMPGPAKTIQDAMRWMQMSFEAIGDCSPPRRLTEQIAHDYNPWNEFTSRIAKVTSLFSELSPEPMVRWPRHKIEKFVETTRPVVEKHEEAKRLLA